MAVAARNVLIKKIPQAEPCRTDQLGAMAAIYLPDKGVNEESIFSLIDDPLHRRLKNQHNIQVHISRMVNEGTRLLRVSAHLYNEIDDYEYLASVLNE